MTEKPQPRRTALPPLRSVSCGQNSADHIFVEFNAKSLGQVLGDLRTAKAGIAPLEFTEGLDQFTRRPFGPRFALGSGGVEESVFELLEPAMEALPVDVPRSLRPGWQEPLYRFPGCPGPRPAYKRPVSAPILSGGPCFPCHTRIWLRIAGQPGTGQ